MASAERSSSNSLHVFHFEKTFPLRDSKTSIGPFKATQIWNELILHLKSKVELKRRRLKMRHYDNCFTGTDAVDVILHYLLSDKETFTTDLSREKAVKVCQLLISRKIFEPVNMQHGNSSKHHFEDSSGKYYCFTDAATDYTENEDPADDSDDESLCDETDSQQCSDIIRCSYPLECLSEQASMCRRSSESLISGLSCSSSQSSLPSISDLRTSHANQSVPLSKDMIQETWREVALAQLTTIIDLTFLDGVLAQDKCSKRQQMHHNLIISNIVAQNWHLPLTQSLVNLNTVGLDEDEDTVVQTAIACIECLPKGANLLAEHLFHSNNSSAKRLAFELLHKHYANQRETILPARFFDLHMAILNLTLQHHNKQALEALRLDMILLPLPVKEELLRLLKFMTALALDSSIVLESSDSNEVVVLRAFSNAIFRHKLLAPNLGSILVQFMMQNLKKMFTVPSHVREKVSLKLFQIKNGKNVPDADTTYCDRLSKEEYEQQSRDCTKEALVSLMNSILDDTKLSLKEKKQRVKQFQKCYPTMYAEHFPGLV